MKKSIELQVIELLNEKIFICENNMTYMKNQGIDSPGLLTDIEVQHGVYTNLKQEIEVLIEENKSSIG